MSVLQLEEYICNNMQTEKFLVIDIVKNAFARYFFSSEMVEKCPPRIGRGLCNCYMVRIMRSKAAASAR